MDACYYTDIGRLSVCTGSSIHLRWYQAKWVGWALVDRCTDYPVTRPFYAFAFPSQDNLGYKGAMNIPKGIQPLVDNVLVD